MKKSEELSRKTRRMIAKNLIILAVLAFVAFVGVSSWFTSSGASARATGVSVQCSVPEGLEVCVVDPSLTGTQLTDYLNDVGVTDPADSHWKSESFTISDQEYPFLSALSLADITGDGKTFISPPIYQVGSVARVRDTKQGSDTDAEFATMWSAGNLETHRNVDYLSLNIYFRTAGSGKSVVLGSNTYYGPPSASNDFGSKSLGYSPNAVIGAARMAVYDSALSSRKLLWIPAPHLYFDGVDLFNTTKTTANDLLDTSNTFGLFYVDGSSATQTIHNDGTYNHGYYNADRTRTVVSYNTAPGAGVTANTTRDFKLHTDVDLAALSSTATYNNRTYYSDFVQMNFWVEGEDPESRSAQITGKFKAVLEFKFDS